MAKGLRIGNKIYPDKIICDGCRKEIDIDTEEIRCSKCVSNLIEYIKKLESQISSLKSQLAIPGIDRDKIIEVLRKYFEEYNFGYLDGVTDEIIKEIRGVKNDT